MKITIIAEGPCGGGKTFVLSLIELAVRKILMDQPGTHQLEIIEKRHGNSQEPRCPKCGCQVDERGIDCGGGENCGWPQ